MKVNKSPTIGKPAAGVVRIPKALDARLTKLAEKTGRAKSYYARKALEQYLEDTEDYLLAVQSLAESKKSYSLAEIRKRFKLDD
jgi:RHH-type rel operon transcriptional repressor/antitoxin RelB